MKKNSIKSILFCTIFLIAGQAASAQNQRPANSEKKPENKQTKEQAYKEREATINKVAIQEAQQKAMQKAKDFPVNENGKYPEFKVLSLPTSLGNEKRKMSEKEQVLAEYPSILQLQIARKKAIEEGQSTKAYDDAIKHIENIITQ